MEHLKRRHNTYYVRVKVPTELVEKVGRREFVKSLKTSDKRKANALKLPYVAEFKRQIEALRASTADPYAAVMAKGLEFKREYDELKDLEGAGEMLGVIKDAAQELLEERGADPAAVFYATATGEGTLLRSYVESFLAEWEGAAQTRSHHRSTIEAFLKWAGGGITFELLKRRKAGEYVKHLLEPSVARSRRTVKRHLSSLSSFWVWAVSRGLTPEEAQNPWLGHNVGAKVRQGGKVKRRAWYDPELVVLLTGRYSTERYNEILQDVTRLSLITGARLDELCATERSDWEKREDGWWLNITKGKTDAAERSVPIHEAAWGIVERRVADATDPFFFPGLTPGGPDKKRSWYVSKAFGRYAGQCGFNDPALVFHSLRHSFTEMMEGVGVPGPTVKLLVGHARSDMTFGVYSKGARVDLRAAIDRIAYGPAVMALLPR